jgi:negative regulator of sigma E activity
MSDSDFDAAWRAFAKGEACVKAPSRVRLGVMAAWDVAHERHAQARSARSHFGPAGAALAAAAVLVAVGLAVRGGNGRSERAPAVDTLDAQETPSATIPNQRAGTVPEAASRRAARSAVHSVRRAGAARVDRSVPAVRLTADPAFESESLQIVRLRVPRTSLEVFGVALLEPEASVLVDVDVVVGDDGLPRDIRRIRPVVHVDELR